MKTIFYPTKKLSIILIVFSFLLAAPSFAASDVYKWTDDDGTIHYSDKKPKYFESKSLKIKAGRTSRTRRSAQEQANTLNEQETQKLAAQAEKLKGDTLKRENDARCQAIRDNLKKIAENSRIKINDNGELRYLTPEEISTKTKQYQQTLKDKCS